MKALKGIFMISALSLATLSVGTLSGLTEAAAGNHPDGKIRAYRAWGPSTDVQRGNFGLLDSTFTAAVYNEEGKPVGIVISTPTNLEFYFTNGDMILSTLRDEPQWLAGIAFDESGTPHMTDVIPLDQLNVAPPLLPDNFDLTNNSDIDDKSQYEGVFFAGRMKINSEGSAAMQGLSTLEFRCAFICKKVLDNNGVPVPGMTGLGEPVFSMNRTYMFN